MSERRDLEPIGSSLDAFLQRIGMPAAVDLSTLVDSWSEVASEQFATMSRPVGLHDGELVVAVENGPAATILKYRLGELLDRLQTHFGADTVQRIRLRVVGGKKGL